MSLIVRFTIRTSHILIHIIRINRYKKQITD